MVASIVASLVLGSAMTPRIVICAYKSEKILEVWGAASPRAKCRLLGTYSIAAASGDLGPKRRRGDLQVPEGFYSIARFNPKSLYHLSLGLNYPNKSDRILGGDGDLGDDIFIHGNAVSAGCLAMTDPVIEVIYAQATYARDHGQKEIPVAIFPCRMTSENLDDLVKKHPDQEKFWRSLKPGYDFFQVNRQYQRPSVDSSGFYTWK